MSIWTVLVMSVSLSGWLFDNVLTFIFDIYCKFFMPHRIIISTTDLCSFVLFSVAWFLLRAIRFGQSKFFWTFSQLIKIVWKYFGLRMCMKKKSALMILLKPSKLTCVHMLRS